MADGGQERTSARVIEQHGGVRELSTCFCDLASARQHECEISAEQACMKEVADLARDLVSATQ